ncbi:MAG: NADH-quinone oxidoreductase subunit C [Desulfobulbaceae bacterium]|nr:NADH-quinone oxidoreductase subunit C [Desulfobulbaceae bacterium]HIJ77692.1 NADH-quinone oxidoreductase subunit C [Deltaproteobacteria bacterium]
MKLAAIKQALAAISPLAIEQTEYAGKGFVLDVKVAADQVVEAAIVLDKEDFFIEAVTGVDWLGEKEALKKEAEKQAAAAAAAKAKAAAEAAEAAGEEAPAAPAPAPAPASVPSEDVAPLIDDLEVVYDFNRYDQLCRVVIRTRVPRDNPEVPTISKVYPGANWHERETHDFFGIKFIGHPDLSPLLLPEDADYHPLLKDFTV